MSNSLVHRRKFLSFGAAALSVGSLSGCDRLSKALSFEDLINSVEPLTFNAQRLLGGRHALAREFQEADISPNFKVNGTPHPQSAEYNALMIHDFVDWRLRVEGLVLNIRDFSLGDLKALPQRTQITRHDCVEGWSAIGKWTGTPLAEILNAVTPLPNAKFVVFQCADDYQESYAGDGRYYESIDLIDAYHPQTILAHQLNDAPLSVGHGAPLRLRVERQLGYKQAKYVMRITLTDSLELFGRGKGGFWPDRGYEWYAGI